MMQRIATRHKKDSCYGLFAEEPDKRVSTSVSLPAGLRDRIDDHVEQHAIFDTRSALVIEAARRLLDEVGAEC